VRAAIFMQDTPFHILQLAKDFPQFPLNIITTQVQLLLRKGKLRLHSYIKGPRIHSRLALYVPVQALTKKDPEAHLATLMGGRRYS